MSNMVDYAHEAEAVGSAISKQQCRGLVNSDIEDWSIALTQEYFNEQRCGLRTRGSWEYDKQVIMQRISHY